jgi:putative hydrolase of the HAD superfamily
MSTIKAVLFDLDDTLYDHSYSSRNGLQALKNKYECLRDARLDVLELEYLSVLNEIHLSKVLTGLSTIEEARIERYKKFFSKFGINADLEFISEARKIYSSAYRTNQRAVPGALELLNKLKEKVKIGIVTNNLLKEQLGKIKIIGITSFIDEIVVSEEAGYIKPSPEIFQIALYKLGCKADECVMIGDSWETDIVGARNAGIRAIWFNRYGNKYPDTDLVFEIDSLEPAEHILKLIF